MAKLLAVFCAALFSCLAISPASARAAVPGQPPHFTVQLLSVNGSGCPIGSTAVSAPNDSTFTVTYDNYLADNGNGSLPTDFRKNCQLDVLLGIPSGFTFGITGIQYRGFAALDSGARGQLTAAYYFPGQPGTFTQNHSVAGPTNSNYEFDDGFQVATWAPCHTAAAVNINSSLQVFQGSDPSFFNEMTMDSTDVGAATIFHVSFRHC
jgi:hypothetical protein